MKLENETIKYITNACKTAQLLGIDDICIEFDIIRAMPEDRTVFLLQHDNIPDIPFDAIGITRIPLLLNRMKIMEDQTGYSIDCKEKEGWVTDLNIKCKGTKVGFKCASPANIKAPRKFKDTPTCRLHFDDATIDMLKRSETAIKTEKLKIVSNDDGVSCEMNDVNNDVFKHMLPTECEIIAGESTLFAHTYPSKMLISLLKHTGKTDVEICAQGSLKININGLDVFVLQKV